MAFSSLGSGNQHKADFIVGLSGCTNTSIRWAIRSVALFFLLSPVLLSAGVQPASDLNSILFDTAYQRKPFILMEKTLKTKIKQVDRSSDYKSRSSYRNRLALLYADNGKAELGIPIAEEALIITKDHKAIVQEAEAYAVSGYLYEITGKVDKAFQFFLQAEAKTRLTNVPQLQFWIDCHLGGIEYNIGDFEESLNWYKQSLLVAFRNKNLFASNNDVINAINSVGLAYRKMHKYDSALLYHRKGRSLATQWRNVNWEGIAAGNIGIDLLELKEFDSAFYYLQKDLIVSVQKKEWRSAAVAYVRLAEIYDHRNEFQKAGCHFDSAKALMAREKLMILTYYQKVSEHYAAIHDFEKSYSFLKRSFELRDSMQSQESSKKVALIKANSQLELLSKDNELKQQQMKIQSVFLIASILCIGLSFTVLVLFYKRILFRKKVNDYLEEKVRKRTQKLRRINKQLDTFIYRSSHDIRRPLTTLLGLDLLGQKIVKDENARELLKYVGDTARGMDKMLTKLRLIHEVNQKKSSQFCDLSEIAKEEFRKLEEDVDRYSVSVTKSSNGNLIVKTNPDLVQIIIGNLLENAIYFSQPQNSNRIHFSIEATHPDHYWIEVSDNGIGIDHTIRDRIFQPFFRGSEYSRGNGLGLYLVKKSVRKLNGSITMESEKGRGATFRIMIPVNSD